MDLSERLKELQKVEKALADERNLDQISFYEGYIKGLKFAEKTEQPKENIKKEIYSPSNLNHLRQYLGELPDNYLISAKELYRIVEVMAPLMTEEQEQQIVKALKSLTKPPKGCIMGVEA